MLRRWFYILSSIWSLLLFLSSSFLLILGQKFLETRPFLFGSSGIFFQISQNDRSDGSPDRSMQTHRLSSVIAPECWIFRWSFRGPLHSNFLVLSQRFWPWFTNDHILPLCWFDLIRILRICNWTVCTGRRLLSTCICGNNQSTYNSSRLNLSPKHVAINDCMRE
jgi:hypothetical protein